MNQSTNASHFNVFTVEEFDAPTAQDQNRKAKSWTRFGGATRRRDSKRYSKS